MTNQTYECPICHAVNHVKKLHCSICGTIRAEYSILRKPSVIQARDYLSVYLEVANAIGCERLDRMRSIKHYLRTVPLDYYAEI